MENIIKRRILFMIMSALTIVFAVSTIFIKNYEFLFYIVIALPFLIILNLYYEKLGLPYYMVFILYAAWALHLIFGIVYINGIRLYDAWWIKGVLKSDQVLHIIGLFADTLAIYFIIKKCLNKKVKDNLLFLFLIMVLMGCGIGSLIEISEFGAVLINPNSITGVGGYFNNAWDLVFNLIGAILAFVFVRIIERKKG